MEIKKILLFLYSNRMSSPGNQTFKSKLKRKLGVILFGYWRQLIRESGKAKHPRRGTLRRTLDRGF